MKKITHKLKYETENNLIILSISLFKKKKMKSLLNAKTRNMVLYRFQMFWNLLLNRFFVEISKRFLCIKSGLTFNFKQSMALEF